jgi:hypothetical protein
MSTKIEVPQEILDAVAAAEQTRRAAAPAVETAPAPVAEEPIEHEPEEAPAATELEPEPEESPAPEAAQPAAEPEAEPAADDAPSADEEVSLEAILEDLKRREGRPE